MQVQRLGPVGIAWRVVVVGIGATLGTILGGVVVTALQLAVPDVPGLDPTIALAVRPLSAILLALVLAPIVLRLDVPTHERTAILFVLLWGLNVVTNVIEGAFFTTWLGGVAAGTLVATAPGHLVSAWLLAVLFAPADASRNVLGAARELFAQRTAIAWLWRFVAAGLAFVPIYYFFGRLIYPFVQGYYEDPAVTLGLRVPSVEEIVGLEIVRGFLFVGLVLPLIVLLQRAWWQRGLLIGLAIAALMAWEPLLTNFAWPVGLRVAHALEITADSFAHAMAIAALLAAPLHARFPKHTLEPTRAIAG